MTTTQRITRRGFVIGGAAAGLSLGFRIPFGMRDAHAQPGAGEVQLPDSARIRTLQVHRHRVEQRGRDVAGERRDAVLVQVDRLRGGVVRLDGRRCREG